MSRTISSLCIAGMTSLALLAPTAAHAAPDGAQGEANALTATILGESGDTGTVRATNDGSGETKTGTANPPISVLTGQPYVGLGVLAQDAVARDNGTSAACAGVAGDGATVVEIGDTGCLTPGDNLALSLATLDLSVLLEGELIEDTGSLNTLLGQLPVGIAVTDVVTALNEGLGQFQTQVGDAALGLDADAIESVCTAEPGSASGTTFLTDVGLGLSLLGTEVPLSTDSDFAPEPAPNTEVLTDLDEVTQLLTDELAASLNAELDPVANPLFVGLLEPLRTQIVTAALEQLTPLFVALQDDILQITLNRQPDDGSDGDIEVTAVAIRVLPAAGRFGAPVDEVASVEIANVACGPFRGAAAPGRPGTTDGAGNPVPTVVNAGESSTPWAQSGLLGLLALLVGGGTVVGLRRARS